MAKIGAKSANIAILAHFDPGLLIKRGFYYIFWLNSFMEAFGGFWADQVVPLAIRGVYKWTPGPFFAKIGAK